MVWSNYKVWIRGGLIGIIIWFVIAITLYFQPICDGAVSCSTFQDILIALLAFGGLAALFGGIPSISAEPIHTFTFWIIPLFTYFIYGSFFGLLINKLMPKEKIDEK